MTYLDARCPRSTSIAPPSSSSTRTEDDDDAATTTTGRDAARASGVIHDDATRVRCKHKWTPDARDEGCATWTIRVDAVTASS
jgi:hypothetical protein